MSQEQDDLDKRNNELDNDILSGGDVNYAPSKMMGFGQPPNKKANKGD
jgi:hypothetical protein